MLKFLLSTWNRVIALKEFLRWIVVFESVEALAAISEWDPHTLSVVLLQRLLIDVLKGRTYNVLCAFPSRSPLRFCRIDSVIACHQRHAYDLPSEGVAYRFHSWQFHSYLSTVLF